MEYKWNSGYKKIMIHLQIFIKFDMNLFVTLKLLPEKRDNRDMVSTNLFIWPIFKSNLNPIILHKIFHT